MKNIFKHLFILVFLITYIQAESTSSCNSQCSISIDEIRGETSDLNCTLSKIPTLKINAKNVLYEEGKLRTYWDGKTVCDVLDWMNLSVPYIPENYNGLSTTFTQTMDLG